jgi:trehalose utilization protein
MPALGAPANDPAAQTKPIRVVVWDEQQPVQKELYPEFLGNWLARHLAARPGLAVKSVSLADPHQGIAPEVLADCDVLMWWGHQRHAEITPDSGKQIVARIKAGSLSLIALHSAHWSTPFVEAMHEKTRLDAARRFAGDRTEKYEITYVPPSPRYSMPRADARITPYAVARKFPGGLTRVAVHLPNCCFPAVRADGKPSYLTVLKPEHPIARGIPAHFELPHTEMYDEPFHVPRPDEVVLEERWAGGEWFRSGSVWQLGKGRVFYFRPGHETFPIYKDRIVLQILENAARWLGTRPG